LATEAVDDVMLLLIANKGREAGFRAEKYVYQGLEKRELLDRDFAPLDLVVEMLLIPDSLNGTE